MKHLTREQLTAPLKPGTINPGDTFTVEGAMQRNPNWRWWKFWVPKFTNNPAVFRVVGDA